MTHNDSVQQIKKTCMGPVVSVVVLVELSGMCWEWVHASIVVMELVAPPFLPGFVPSWL